MSSGLIRALLRRHEGTFARSSMHICKEQHAGSLPVWSESGAAALCGRRPTTEMASWSPICSGVSPVDLRSIEAGGVAAARVATLRGALVCKVRTPFAFLWRSVLARQVYNITAVKTLA
eukprot:6091218-Pleurochrysis_carterae.AAC.6